MKDLVTEQKAHLAGLLEAIQRCVYFLEAAEAGISWPLTGEALVAGMKDVRLFGNISAINERFSKLQDTLGAAMRHSLELSGERAESFLRVLAFFEKRGVISSGETWQTCRAARNLAAHDYETDYGKVAEHFNTLHELKPHLLDASVKFVAYCEGELGILPASSAFSKEFSEIASDITGQQSRASHSPEQLPLSARRLPPQPRTKNQE
jgi:hypothetical protein